jgi:hypothetical protein
VFDVIERNIQGKKTIGDIGIFWEDSPEAEHWKEAIYPVKYFIDQVMGYENKSDGLYISVRVHPCSYQVLPLFTPARGFQELTPFYSHRAAGERKMLAAPYSDFLNKFFPVKGKPHLEITNDSGGKIIKYT